jgi:helicase SWR1
MDIDPPRLSSRSANHSNLQDTSPSSLASHPTSFHGSDGANQSASSRSRLLRTRPSDPLPGPPTVAKHTSPVASIRKPLQKELNNIHRRLDSEWVKSRREELLREKERHLKRVVDGHDDAVREKFHLEKFVSLLEGWDPGVSFDLSWEDGCASCRTN